MVLLAACLKAAATMVASLPQYMSNGGSMLGTAVAPTYPQYMTDNPMPDGYPWGTRTAKASNPYTEMPYTGVTRYYNWTISEMTLAPDGYSRPMVVVNQQYPGPTIEANWGDWWEINVQNDLDEGTAIHWHGLLQTNTVSPFHVEAHLQTYMDGVPGVHQCPIAPGESYTYRFRADLYGTSWYHSHFSSQYTAGLFGAMIVYGPPTYPYDVDLGPVICNDYYHTYYTQLTMDLMSTNEATSIGTGTSDNNLINGKNNFNCSSQDTSDPCVSDAGLSKFFFEPGKVHRLRFINSGAEGTLHISIDGHTMRIIAVDFVPVEAVEVQVISLALAQRCDVLVTGTGKPGESYWMRSMIQPCSGALNPSAKAAIYYPDADQTLAPTSEAWPDTLPPCIDMPASTFVPYYSSTPPAPSEMAQVNDFQVEFIQNSTGYWLWTVNGVSYRSDYNEPTLLLTKNTQPNSPLNFPAEYNAYTVSPGNNTNQFVMYHVENTVAIAHPMHLHGHNMWLISQGNRTWDGTVVRANNPPRRDVFMCPAGGHLVVAYEANNPGIWPFHCHIAWHLGAGLFVQGVEQPDWIQEYMSIPTPSYEQCRTWWSYTGHTVVPEIDSGL